MGFVKYINKLEDLLSKKDLEKLDYGAQLYNRHATITFKVLKVVEEEIIIEVRQEKNAMDGYLSLKELNKRAKNLFGRFFPDHDIHTRPKPYKKPPPDKVTPKWVQKHMLDQGVKLIDLVEQTGIHKSTLSTLVNGNRPMSQPVKAMFYYFFEERK